MSVATRACGDRIAGGAYLVFGNQEGGLPVEHFLVDEPQQIVPRDFGLTPIGTVLMERLGTTHVLDWVGSDFYPNVADFIEEVRRYGMSRRIAKNSDFSRLTNKSRVLLVHERAFIENATLYQQKRPQDEYACFHNRKNHTSNSYRGMCASLYWEDVAKGIPADSDEAPRGVLCGDLRCDMTGCHMHRHRNLGRAVVREMPSFAYRALRRPDGVQPIYSPAIFMALPINGIEVIRDKEGGTHEETMDRAMMSRLPVTLEDE